MERAPEALNSLIAISALHQAYDGAAKILENYLGVPLCIRCGKCCEHNTPFAYGIEAANAVSRLIGQGKSYKFQRRIEGWLLERHKECTVYEPLKLDKVSFGLDNRVRDEALALSRTPCLFYEDKSCLVYDARPMVCRAHGVTRHIDSCSRPFGKDEHEGQRIYMAGAPVAELKLARAEILKLVPKPTWALAGFFPTLIFSLMWPNRYQNMVSNGLIATAKLIMTSPSMAVFEETTIEALTKRDMVLV